MEEKIKKQIISLSIRMELTNYVGGVPLAVFFLVLSQKMYYEKFYYIALSFLAAVSITLIIFPYWRAKIFHSLFDPLLVGTKDSELSFHKENLLKFPT
ncbi:MAG TPA: hypothetical protein PK079_02945 [Leptospiraceae bacterium]|nr:hypothetical protein [Leptospiraceae bacterium]HMW04452.1 hypothetical protein [Leptospiraceae bacterium]HMX31110.1 hypothetical protein [Leptospiraceae bacterium]HMY30638.1 hypothetical protein [Leptospiraceae bacterium]HMZ64420.1 hypothetical protein [Leptospiraceae bacterium]